MSAEPSDATRVTILDEPFAIRSEADPEYTRRVAGHVDRTLRDLRVKVPSMEPFQAAVLGAMEITDELFRLRERLDELEGEFAARVTDLADAIRAATEPGKESRGRRKGENAAR